MEWSSLIGVAILLTLVIFVMRVLWCWLIVLLMLGPPTFAGVVVGHTVGVLTHNVGVGVLVAVVVTGLLHKVALLKPQTIARMIEVQSRRIDQLLGFEVHWAHGVARNTTGVFGPNASAFGHTGWGGSFGYADPESGVGASYVMNRMGPDLIGDARAVALVQAIGRRAS